MDSKSGMPLNVGDEVYREGDAKVYKVVNINNNPQQEPIVTIQRGKVRYQVRPSRLTHAGPKTLRDMFRF